MALLVGIDEAGYGPQLGPLVVAATYWCASSEHAQQNLWKTLKTVVVNAAEEDVDYAGARLPVADSKIVYDRNSGLHTLERTVLAFGQASGAAHTSVLDWLTSIGAEAPGASALPWYREVNRQLPIDPHRSACAGVAERLGRAMRETGLQCSRIRAAVVPEDSFNQRLRATRNKSSLVVEQVLHLMRSIAELPHEGDVYFRIDRLGGRANYREILQDAFPDRHLYELMVSPECSRYRLAAQNDWHVEFLVDADRHHLPVALASMVAKYTRELMMIAFNNWWRRQSPDLKPTAGYYGDAARFLRDIRPLLPQTGLTASQFARIR